MDFVMKGRELMQKLTDGVILITIVSLAISVSINLFVDHAKWPEYIAITVNLSLIIIWIVVYILQQNQRNHP